MYKARKSNRNADAQSRVQIKQQLEKPPIALKLLKGNTGKCTHLINNIVEKLKKLKSTMRIH